MGRYVIKGGKNLNGEVLISGSKNATLPLLSATLINGGENIIKNCPNITDVNLTCDILEELGCSVKRDRDTIIINSANAKNRRIKKENAEKMRSSVLFMGVMLGKFGQIVINKPGGCAIGKRPVDYHLNALKAMGADIIEHETLIECRAEKLVGTKIFLPMPSVGATENIMLAGAFAEGETIIFNPAREPEIFALQEYLKIIGIKVQGAGSTAIRIEGRKKFNNGECEVLPDRIEAGTFLIATAMTKGDILLKNVNWIDMIGTLDVLNTCGCTLKTYKDSIYIKAPKKLTVPALIRTGGYPLFPTDMQPAIMSLLTMSEGTSIIIEQMFENRFCQAKELNKMGAKISAGTSVALVDGVDRLRGCEVTATDLRAGAALILAGLRARGTTIVNNSKYVLRGYENFDEKLRALGANIKLDMANDED